MVSGCGCLKHFEHTVRDQKPPTTLLVAATMAMVPSTVDSVVLVFSRQQDCADHGNGIERVGQDISGVCRSGDTRRITSKPIKPPA